MFDSLSRCTPPAMSELCLSTRTDELITMTLRGPVSAHARLVHGHSRDQCLSPPATWRVKVFAVAFPRDSSRVIHGLILLVPSSSRSILARCARLPISASSGEFATPPRFDDASPLRALSVLVATNGSASSHSLTHTTTTTTTSHHG